MGKLDVISAGAAQSVVERAGRDLAAAGVATMNATFGAVGAQKERLLSGAPADVVILTAALIDELIAAGHLRAGSRVDLGPVGSGVAVRSGTPWPDISTPERLRAALLAATTLYIPDPEKATAGIQFMKNCERLGIAAEARAKMRCYPNGYTAMTHMAASNASGEIGVTQITEIKFVRGVDLVGPVPRELQTLTTYSLGIATRAVNLDAAAALAAALTGPAAADLLAEAGFGLA
jgi:molybdate transport system substrate-binding protein